MQEKLHRNLIELVSEQDPHSELLASAQCSRWAVARRDESGAK